MLTVLASYNVSVEELKAIFYKLKGQENHWVYIDGLLKSCKSQERLRFLYFIKRPRTR